MPAATAPPPPDLNALVNRDSMRHDLDLLLDAACQRVRARVKACGPSATRLNDLLEVMLTGGKRLRAAFIYWSWRAHGGTRASSARSTALGVAEALELFQAAALFHDDVIDRSDRRRNHPTAHVVLASDHRAQGWTGDPTHYGVAGAILLGDLALVAAQESVSRAADALSPGERTRLLDLWNLMVTQVTAGQFLDVQLQEAPWGQDPASDEANAQAVILAKTASYSAEIPLAMGAVIAGATEDSVTSIRSFGRTLGQAFQLRDDILGVFGDPEQTGKPAGDDVREGKRTVLMARAAAAASPTQLAVLLRALGDPELDERLLSDVRDIIIETGALSSLERLITEHYDHTLTLLAESRLQAEGRTVLAELARATVQRSA